MSTPSIPDSATVVTRPEGLFTDLGNNDFRPM